jgi:hypothetical protein
MGKSELMEELYVFPLGARTPGMEMHEHPAGAEPGRVFEVTLGVTA